MDVKPGIRFFDPVSRIVPEGLDLVALHPYFPDGIVAAPEGGHEQFFVGEEEYGFHARRLCAGLCRFGRG